MKFRLVLVAAVMLAGSHAIAQRVCKNYDVSAAGATGSGSTPATACSSLVGKEIQVGRPVATVVGSTPNPENPEGKCDVSYTSTGTPGATFWTVATMIPRDVTCDDDVCAASASPITKNVTVGYVRNRGDNDGVVTFNPGAPNQVACDGMCTLRFGGIEAVWESQGRASNGMYRVSYDMQTFRTGGTCDAVDEPLDSKPETVKPCDGAMGEVNGKPYCAKSPNGNTTLPPPPLPASDGNPTAGSRPTPGVDRTPNTGGGGPEGGPRGGTNPSGSGTVILPGTGGGASGTVAKPGDGKEQANCGAPGQPKCSINEEGTPSANDGKALFDGPLKALEQVSTDAKKAFDDAKSLKAEPWTFTFQLPTGCTDLSFDWGAFGGIIKVDVCKHQPLIHSLMSFLWICAGIGGSFILLQRTVSG